MNQRITEINNDLVKTFLTISQIVLENRQEVRQGLDQETANELDALLGEWHQLSDAIIRESQAEPDPLTNADVLCFDHREDPLDVFLSIHNGGMRTNAWPITNGSDTYEILVWDGPPLTPDEAAELCCEICSVAANPEDFDPANQHNGGN